MSFQRVTYVFGMTLLCHVAVGYSQCESEKLIAALSESHKANLPNSEARLGPHCAAWLLVPAHEPSACFGA